MNPRPVSQCNKSWDFQPVVSWPTRLPSMCWGPELLTGFERSSGDAIDLSDSGDVVATFRACYPQLSLAELARLWKQVQSSAVWKDQEESLFRAYGLRWNDELKTTCELLVQLPLVTQHWSSEKQLGVRDLAPLRALPNPQVAEELWLLLPSSRLSKSEGVQAIEWAIDLLLMGHDWQTLKPTTSAVDGNWLSHLKKLRYPRTSVGDEHVARTVSQLPWPVRTQGQWRRQGDKGLLEIQIKADSLTELKHQLAGLKKVETVIEENDVLWKK